MGSGVPPQRSINAGAIDIGRPVTMSVAVSRETTDSDVSRETVGPGALEVSANSESVKADVSRETEVVVRGGRHAAPATPETEIVSGPAVSRETVEVPGLISRETSPDDLPIAVEAQRAVAVINPTGKRLPRPVHPRVFSVANQKGGVGKTTTAVNLAVSLALHGLRTLVIDLDPQGNASTGLDVEHRSGTPGSYDILLDEMAISEAMVPVPDVPNLSCIPATIDLAGAEIELVEVAQREHRLKAALATLPSDIDYVFIDCPPSLGLLTVNAMVAAREILIPIQCEYYALEGLGQLIHNVDLVRAHLNPDLRISTILLTMYDRRTKLADQVANEVRGHFGDKVLSAVIPRSVRVSEAPGYGQSVMTYDPGSRGATSYLAAATELAERYAVAG